MALLIDLHLHTSRYSRCSVIPPERLIDQAVNAGLDGAVITEHHVQWSLDELEELRKASSHPGFLLLAGFEYTSRKGDLLIYGVDAQEVSRFEPCWPPEQAVALATELGGVCIAAHPTRAGLGFDTGIAQLQLAALEVRSVNLQPHEQRMAVKLAEAIGARQVACSDAHTIQDVGRFATEFDMVIRDITDLRTALTHGRFRVAEHRVSA
ncbi:MAG: PHP domain-containing protein [Candidatus Hydrogenedentes bacterium]|nr:PHP domain-containing protein [Candidatus Hydrogenedentota bacterium]